MNIDDADHLHAEHLAKWLKLTREYLFGPMPGAGSSQGTVSRRRIQLSRSWEVEETI
jgi:hypothetical protein